MKATKLWVYQFHDKNCKGVYEISILLKIKDLRIYTLTRINYSINDYDFICMTSINI
jgi:hypothetical protein